MNTTKTLFNRLGCFLLAMFLILAIFPVTASASEPQENVVRVGVLNDAYIRVNSNGDRNGYGYEYQQAVAAITGWTYEYVRTDWSNCYDMLQSGEIDMLGGVSFREERSGKMLFSSKPMGEERYYLFKDSTDNSISIDDLNALNGKNVGVLKDSIPEKLLNDWENSLGITTNHVNIVSAEETLDKIESHEIDCFVSLEDPLWVSENLSAFAHIGDSDVFFVFNNERMDLKAKLDSAMRQIDLNNPYFTQTLYKDFFTTTSAPSLSAEEKDWLVQHGTIKVGYLDTDPGISVVDPESGEPVGALNDYIEIAKNCFIDNSVDFDLIGFSSQAELHQALKDGKIDAIAHVSHNSSKAEDNQFILSEIVCELNVAVITGKNTFDENAENTVAVSKDNILSKWYILCNYPKWKMIEYDSTKEVENAVRNGKADGFVVRTGLAAKTLEDRKIRSVFLTKPDYASFAVRRQDTILLSIINKTLRTIPSSQLSGAVSMYDNAIQKITFEDFVKDNLNIVIAVFIIVFAVVFMVVFTLLKKTRRALALAEKANAAKTNFLFNMSHDIRTPMNALLGYSELMKKELTDPKLLDYQEKVEQSGNLLLSIINNVLDMARIESGKMEIDENYANISKIVGEITDVFEEAAKAKNITLIHEVNVVHNHIMCDETKIKQILVNLLSNAVKYTPEGGTVSVIWTEIPADKEGFVKIKAEIADNGIGMSKEFMSHVFESFARERNTTIGKVAGTGLGLPIVKSLVELMDGSIQVESEQGKGSTFTVILQHREADKVYYERKADEAKPDTSSDNSREKLVGRHILLAEDNELNAEIAITILEEMGLIVDRVEDGIRCVDRIMQEPAGTYELILMDIQMPNMDGYKATLAIRRLTDKEKSNIPIVAMTANAFEEDKKKALEHGMNDHLSKPIDVDKITQTLLSLLQ